MLKFIAIAVVVLALAMAGKSYYKKHQIQEAAAKVAQQEADKKAADVALEQKKQTELARAKKEAFEVAINAARAAVERQLRDPISAQFRNIRANAIDEAFQNISVCGEVNSKNGFGGYVGFKRFVFNGMTLNFEPDTNTETKFRQIYEVMEFLNCTPSEQREVICKETPQRCSLPHI